jgi:hypothetical protein
LLTPNRGRHGPHGVHLRRAFGLKFDNELLQQAVKLRRILSSEDRRTRKTDRAFLILDFLALAIFFALSLAFHLDIRVFAPTFPINFARDTHHSIAQGERR